nr:MAG TPA: hypothetical protein [Caudoviricetes sp.]
MIYNACQIGLKVNVEDLALHTLLDVSDFAASLVNQSKKNENVTPMSFSELCKAGKKKW